MSWNKDISQLKSLEAALSVLRQIPMKHMRHGKRVKNFLCLKIYVYSNLYEQIAL